MTNDELIAGQAVQAISQRDLVAGAGVELPDPHLLEVEVEDHRTLDQSVGRQHVPMTEQFTGGIRFMDPDWHSPLPSRLIQAS